MKITKVEIVKLENSKRLRAVCYVVIDNTIVIDNVRLFQKNDGEFFVQFPRSHSSKKRITRTLPLLNRFSENTLKGLYSKNMKKS